MVLRLPSCIILWCTIVSSVAEKESEEKIKKSVYVSAESDGTFKEEICTETPEGRKCIWKDLNENVPPTPESDSETGPLKEEEYIDIKGKVDNNAYAQNKAFGESKAPGWIPQLDGWTTTFLCIIAGTLMGVAKNFEKKDEKGKGRESITIVERK